MISGLIERERLPYSQTMEHFFVTDLAAKYRELVSTESPAPPKPIYRQGYYARNYLGPKELLKVFSTGSSNQKNPGARS